MKNMKLWIARDEAVVPEDMEHFIERHPEKEVEFAKLHIFYDKPYWSGCDGKWYGMVQETCVKYLIICFPKSR